MCEMANCKKMKKIFSVICGCPLFLPISKKKPLEGEFIFNQKGLLLVIDDDGLLMPTQLLEVR